MSGYVWSHNEIQMIVLWIQLAIDSIRRTHFPSLDTFQSLLSVYV